MPKPHRRTSAAPPSQANLLLIGGGGREHALAWRLRQSPRVARLWLTDPGNAGLATLGEPCPEPLNFSNIFRMQRWCDRNEIHLVVVGPEAPLAAGVADLLATGDRLVFGPGREGARIESDKAFAKQLMRQAGIPTADARVFDDPRDAAGWIRAHDEPCVVKAAGLAAGKGAIVCGTPEDATAAIERIMIKREFGSAGDRLLIEEKLSGQEVSVMALVAGRHLWLLDPCQDHKQLGEGDTGPNTGGMGAYCPTPVLDEGLLATVQREVMVPAADALRREGIAYCGVLYAGIMLTPGGPKVLEFNCRFGDPECQPLMARLRGDLFELLWATCAAAGGGAAGAALFDEADLSFDERSACCVVMCSGGYPGPHEAGKPITGIEEAEALSGGGREVIVFHAGTRIDDAGRLVSNGGRVLGVTVLAGDLAEARDLANEACARIHFEGAYWRRDIGGRVLKPVSRTGTG